jgi:hypothetical protein
MPMATDLSIQLHGPMPQDTLQRMRDLLRLEAADAGANAPRDEVGRRYLDDLHTVFLVLLRRADDAWEAQVTSLLAPASHALVQQCTEDVRAAAAELGLAVGGEGASAAPEAEAAAGPETEAKTEAVSSENAAPAPAQKVTAPPPGAGPVSLEQAEAIAVEWVNAGRPDDAQVTAGVYEFELGYIVYPKNAPRTEIGTARGIIDKETGECSVWPSLSLEMVADLYRERARKTAAAGSGGKRS